HREGGDRHNCLENAFDGDASTVADFSWSDRPEELNHMPRKKRLDGGLLPTGYEKSLPEGSMLGGGNFKKRITFDDIRESGQACGVAHAVRDKRARNGNFDLDQGIGDSRGAGDIEGIFVLDLDAQAAGVGGKHAETEGDRLAGGRAGKHDVAV